MSLWQRLIEGGKRLFDVNVVDDPVPNDLECAPDPNDVGFTAAVVGLGAKMAMADGRVTDDEIMVFSRVFRTAPKDANAVRRVFRLAQQTVSGYESYARKIGKKYQNRPCLLEGVLDGLFMIATADGVVTDDELTYLETVSRAFGFKESTFRRIKAGHMVAHDAEFDEIKRTYRKLMADNHPDRVVYHGAPREFESAAHDKAATITGAYARIKAERGLIAVN
jgi:DnaJ like chaperone protein